MSACFADNVFVVESSLRAMADWYFVIRASRSVCAIVTDGIDLGWLGLRATRWKFADICVGTFQD